MRSGGLGRGHQRYGQPILTSANNVYHAQIYNNWCGTASIEMMLDCPAVTGGNTQVATNLLAAGDGATVPAGNPQPLATVVGGVVQPGGAQAFIYGMTHGGGPNNNTVNGVWYFNPNVPFGSGTDSFGVVSALNLFDNPNTNGQFGPPFPAVGHNYVGYNAAPTALGAAAATRTIVNCIADYQVPAQIVVGGGAHSMIANGAITTGQPGRRGRSGRGQRQLHALLCSSFRPLDRLRNFSTGIGRRHDRLGREHLASLWIRHPGQWPRDPVDSARRHNRKQCAARHLVQLLQPEHPQLSNGFNVTSYKFTVEPQGPESLDTGDPAMDGSLPAPPPLISPIMSAAGALSYAGSDLSASTQLSTDFNLMGSGSFDSNPNHEMLLQMPNSDGGDGDWLVPYDGSGGVNDIQGALLIDQDTGVIDEATWLTPGDNLPGYTLSQIDAMMQDEASGNLPNDNPVPLPEPGSIALLAAGGLIAVARWRASAASISVILAALTPP